MGDSSTSHARRAKNVAELREVLSRFATPGGVALGLAFEPRPSDVFIATFPKCGTTLVQQMVHGLRTGGDMAFQDISEVIPWIEMAADLQQDPKAEQRANPRVFKTHLGWENLPKGGRSIYVLREPEAVLRSLYHFFSGWFFEADAIDFERFALDYVLGREGDGDYWTHLISWWPQRHSDDVLYLFYEDIVPDLLGTTRRIASFLNLEVDEARIEIAARQSRIDFMRKFPKLWEDELIRIHRNPAMGLPASASSTKVRAGAIGNGPEGEVGEKVRSVWRAKWQSEIEPVTGCADYAALRAEIHRIQRG